MGLIPPLAQELSNATGAAVKKKKKKKKKDPIFRPEPTFPLF